MSSEELVKLRAELKQWENTFLATHGRKPGRGDVKQSPEIAAKYKVYNKLRDPAPAKTATSERKQNVIPGHPRTPSKKSSQNSENFGITENFNDDPFRSPGIKKKILRSGGGPTNSARSTRSFGDNNAPVTPTNVRRTPAQREYDSPLSLRRLRFGKNGDTVEATPQKAGKVLGIFESAIIPGTPPKGILGRKPLDKSGSPLKRSHETDSHDSQTLETPKKQKCGDGESGSVPSSKGRAVPIKAKGITQSSPITPRHPKVSPSKDPFATPSFLRRSTSQIFSAAVESPPIPVPRSFKPPTRGLSSLLAELRKMQDEAVDQEEDILREMEIGDVKLGAKILSVPIILNSDNKTNNTNYPTSTTNKENVLEDVALIDKNEKIDQVPTRIWKKKGLKRQTRRVKMRPVRKRPSRTVPQRNYTQDESDNGECELQESVAYYRRTPAEKSVGEAESSDVNENNVGEEGEGSSTGGYSDGDDDRGEYYSCHDGTNEHEENDNLHDKQNTNVKAKVTSKSKPSVRAKTNLSKPTREVLSSKPKGSKCSAEKQSDNAKNGTHNKVSKTSSTAHANYRKLKIRGAGGGKGRFYKRRK